MPINIFVFGDETHVHAIGWRLYEKAGTDDELKAFLQSKVHDDHQIAARKLSAGTVITQEQLDKTVAGPTEKSPIFMGDVRDAKTEAPLNWQQRTP